MKPLVSVIIPTRNRPHLLGDALGSVAVQDLPSGMIEAVVVNDGGVTVDAQVRAAADRDLAVRVIVLSGRQGLPAARNAGLSAARGEYVALLDDDDVYLPSHFRVAITALENDDVDAVYTTCVSSTVRVDPSRPVPATTYAYGYRFCPELLSVTNFIPVHAVVFRRCPARFDPGLSALEDWDMWLRLVRAHSYRFRHLPEVTTVYHRIPQHASHTMTGSAATRSAVLHEFGVLQRQLWKRWPAASAKAARFRLYLAVMYWQALGRMAVGEPVAYFYYQRTLREIIKAWAGDSPEGELVGRIAAAVEEDAQ